MIGVKESDTKLPSTESHTSKYYSLKITEFLMRVVGFWNAKTEKEQFILDVIFRYMIIAITFALGVEGLDFYYSWGDFYAITYTACSSMPLLMVLIKVCKFITRRKEIISLIKYTQDNFWFKEYDDFGKSVLDNIDKKGLILVSVFTFFVQGTVVTYTTAPIIENIGKSGTDRILPFKIWINVPSTTTPYFEILFVVETLALTHCGFCFCSFDNFLTVLCIHASGQFKILQHRVETLFNGSYLKESKQLGPSEMSNRIYDEFKNCVKQHLELIGYVEKLEYMFSQTTLCQLLISSIMLCVAGFQVCLGRGTLVRRIIFYVHVTGSFIQVLIITLTMNEVIVESRAVGDAAYKCNWESTPYKTYKRIRDGAIIMMMRASRPCCITAGGFSVVSLETFMGVLSTSASYFTLLRKLEEQ